MCDVGAVHRMRSLWAPGMGFVIGSRTERGPNPTAGGTPTSSRKHCQSAVRARALLNGRVHLVEGGSSREARFSVSGAIGKRVGR